MPLKKLCWLVASLALLVSVSNAAPNPPDPRVERIKAELRFSNLFLQQGAPVISKLQVADFLGFPASSINCPPVGQARAFYDTASGTFRVINSSCADILGGGSGSGTKWNNLLNPNGDLSPDFGGANFTFANGIWDWGNMDMRVPHSASLTPATVGQIGYDTGTANLQFFGDTRDIIARMDASLSVNDGDLLSLSLDGSRVRFVPRTVNDPTGTSILQVNNVNVQIGDSPCVTGLGPPLEYQNCTPGVPVNLQTGTTYTFDAVNDRGTAIVSSNVGAQAYSLPLISDATDFDGSWFVFQLNKNSGTVTFTATSPNTFDSTGTATETLREGENVSFLTDTTNGIIYPKFSPGRLTAGTGVTIAPTAGGYGQTISATSAAPSGPAGGALAGTYPNPTLANATNCTNQFIRSIAQATALGTCASVAGTDMTNNTVTATQLAAQYSKLRCETGLGDGLNAMAAGTYLQFFCVNTSGVTWTITGISCWTDNAGTSTLNAANNAGTGLLTGAVTCNSTKSGGGAAGTQSGTTTLANNDAISFTFVADGTSKQTTWTVSLSQ